ncbi:MAG: Hsp70 family protein, partial [Treponema sp.]|nr:Hsp70 family protein [Treponema sp.]
MASTIGIKIANGEFYSLVEENSAVKKRLILTTVHDNQHSVQIDLYKSYTKTMADALYIGSLVVEKIKPRPKGEPSIEMVISSTQEGEIVADAIDMDTSHGEHQVLSVSLKSLDEDNREYEIPDFELEQNEAPPTGLYDRASAVKKEATRAGIPWTMVIIIGVALVLILLALWYFLIGKKPGSKPAVPVQTEKTVPAEEPPPAREAAPEPPAPEAKPPAGRTAQEPPPVIQAPAESRPAPAVDRRNRPPAPVSSYKVPATIPKEGAPYKIRWGDTLWDISEAFYRNPWL